MKGVEEPRRSAGIVWEEVADRDSPSWYLDPMVAEQKRSVNLSLLSRWAAAAQTGTLLKTDLFEEANGRDEVFSGCSSYGRLLGMDLALGEVARARQRTSVGNALFVVTDVRQLALAPQSVNVVFSNSTLDHFETAAELDRSLGELSRVLRPRGTAIITLDNSRNPLYWLLRLVARSGRSPFPLGVTTSLSGLVRRLEATGLEITDTDYLIHNPRVLSTALFLALRKILGSRADRLVGWFLRAFGVLDRLPTRGLTACFVAVCARRPEAE
jgi:SAM-dependent methyltransferase